MATKRGRQWAGREREASGERRLDRVQMRERKMSRLEPGRRDHGEGRQGNENETEEERRRENMEGNEI